MSDKVRKDFEDAEPAQFRRHGGDERVFRKIRQVETWARAERLAVARTIAENREAWLNEERRREMESRGAPSLELAPPELADFRETVEQAARRRVSLKIEGLMAAVEAERNRRIEEIVNLPHASHARAPETRQAASFRPEGREVESSAAIHARAQRIRREARAHFQRMRPLFIADAEASGSDTPVKDVYDNYRKRMARIDRAENSLLAAPLKEAFRRHSIDGGRRGPTMS